VRPCSACGAWDTTDPCAVCADQARDGSILCVVDEVGASGRLSAAALTAAATTCWAGCCRRSTAWGRRRFAVGPLVARAGPGRSARGDPGAAGHGRWPDDGPLCGGTGSPAQASRSPRWLGGVPVGGDLDWLDDGTNRHGPQGAPPGLARGDRSGCGCGGGLRQGTAIRTPGGRPRNQILPSLTKYSPHGDGQRDHNHDQQRARPLMVRLRSQGLHNAGAGAFAPFPRIRRRRTNGA
jgi:hypothetical protein